MRLNNKTIRNYLFYSSIIFLLTIPLSYFVVRSVLLRSVDHSLRTQMKEIRSNLGAVHSRNELAIWSKLDKDIDLSPTDQDGKDKLYSIYHFNDKHNEEEPYREISGVILAGGQRYLLVIRSSLIENEDLLGSILMVQCTVLILLITGMLWINQRVSRKLWRPFYIALKNMQQFELNKQSDLSFVASTTDEFNQLNKAIKNLFARNQELFLQQKEFTENASHEIQTPLAIFQSKLELLMQTGPLSEEQAELITALNDTNCRLIKLNKSLLLLTKIENDQYQSVEEVDVPGTCERLIGQFVHHADEKNITIRTDLDSRIFVKINKVLIEILISNLLSNAIRYNNENGEILVRTEGGSLTIENTGLLLPLHPEKIFDRFYKQHGQAGSEDSTGLGLAIVTNICALYNHNISYSFTKERHSFRISFTGTSSHSEYRQNQLLP